MAVADGQPAEVLEYTSQAYSRHKPQIDAIRREGKALEWIHSGVEQAIFGPRGIVCDRQRGDKEESASGLYFGRTLQVTKETDQKPLSVCPPHIQSGHPIVLQTLAVRLSILHEVSFPPATETSPTFFDGYLEAITDFDEFSREHRFPSILPALYLPGALLARLKNVHFTEEQQEFVPEFLERLGTLCSGSEKHLHALMTGLTRHHRAPSEIISVLECATDFNGTTIDELCTRNPAFITPYVTALIETQQYDRLIAFAEGHFEGLRKYFMTMTSYVRVLQGTRNVKAFQRFLAAEGQKLVLTDPSFLQMVIDMLVDFGWVLYAAGDYDKVIALLDAATQPKSALLRDDGIDALYRQTYEEMGDDAKEAFAAYRQRARTVRS